MPLESLLELVKTLSERIDRHSSALRQSEALTRYALIDPLLRELGWDTSDPGMVIPEYRSGNRRADYALMNNGSPAMMVEAKSLDTNLGPILSQGIQYCLELGTKFFCVTDGCLWEIYETHKPVPIGDKRIVRFNLKDEPSQVCLNALALWRRSAESGSVSVGQSPAIEHIQDQVAYTQPSPVVEPPVIRSVSAVPIANGGGWQPLSEFKPEVGKVPSELLLPDNTTAQIRNWKSVIVEVAKWLVDKNLLGPSLCPIQFSSSRSRYVVHTTPTHPNGKSFFAHAQVGSLHIETHANSEIAIRKAQLIIETAGRDPSHFKVRLS